MTKKKMQVYRNSEEKRIISYVYGEDFKDKGGNE
jgi:hypothetical protein